MLALSTAGHSMTHKISANITNITKQLKKTITAYNKTASSCDLEQESLPCEITWEMVNNIHSHLWVSSSSSDIDIPANVRRDAMNKYFIQQRAREEIDLIKLEMKRFISMLHNRIDRLTTSLPLTPSYEQTVEEMGKSGMINSRIRELCVKVLTLRKTFALYYVDVNELPNEGHTCDLYSPDFFDEEQQTDIDYWHSVAEERFERTERLRKLEAEEQESCDESVDSDDMNV